MDENVEYEERESEFDLTDEDKSVASGADDKEDTDLEVYSLIVKKYYLSILSCVVALKIRIK